MPQQEAGVRSSCALPYELYADGRRSPDGERFEIQLIAATKAFGSGAAGAPFNVYLRNLKKGEGDSLGFRCATYAVKAGDSVSVSLPIDSFVDSRYVVEVHAPNGFYRSFTGGKHSSQLQIRSTYEQSGSMLTGNAVVLLRHTSEFAMHIEITDNAYRSVPTSRIVDPGCEISIALDLQSSHGWYDYTVRAKNDEGNEIRYAGRVETGRPSISDPKMGRII
jgi:phospholipase C